MRELFYTVVVRVVGSDESNVRAEMSGYAGFRAFTDRVKGQSQIPLLYFEKLFAKVCDYHYIALYHIIC